MPKISVKSAGPLTSTPPVLIIHQKRSKINHLKHFPQKRVIAGKTPAKIYIKGGRCIEEGTYKLEYPPIIPPRGP
ncbi:hypothetical protein CHY_0106 [Carboxydothermus hydrogenoformans Z-2901]|uniref:Uncharacterized protein n=1 Tax=Carboxydothermus hydrogenoformans (strain ATCC BAA-161 / DSM 6008 / Z-2901) TaxID=246194 RepID=Q3AFV6_CARHZ|nr:hypothetical protein CHY_0106 [Carboxydothermus hydrogenoformans Z-2901]